MRKLLKSVDKLLGRIGSKRIVYISSEDKKCLEGIIRKWNVIKKSEKLPSSVRTELNDQIQICIEELKKQYPLKEKIRDSLKFFRAPLYGAVIQAEAKAGKKYPISEVMREMNRLKRKIRGKLERDYFAEAEKCLRVGAKRAFIVMTWNIVIYRVYKRIEAEGLQKFENAYNAKYGRSRPIKINTIEDLYYVRDENLFHVCQDLGIFDKHLKEMFLEHLKIRNKCAHISIRYKPTDGTILKFTSELIENFLLSHI